MSVPVSQMWTVASYVLKQVLARKKRYPLVLMLEPLLKCNLACAGCGKIQYPGHILQQQMAVADALEAVDECGCPIVSIPGGEPLMYDAIGELVTELVRRKKYIYLCTNAILLKQKIEEGVFKPSKYLSFSVHMDGDREAHDFAVCKEGVYDQAEEAIRFAVEKGFRVTSNTTVFDHVDTERMRAFFDRMMGLGVEGMMISPGYSYQKAPDQGHFLSRSKTFNLFQSLLENAKKEWKFNHSPLFLEYLMGKRHFECTPWGNPCFTLFGWQKPCYLLQEGYTQSFQELMDETDWDAYGRASGNEKCQQCMVHCGHEPTAVHHTFASFRGFFDTVRSTIGGIADKAPQITPPSVTRTVTTGLEATEPGSVDRALWEVFDFRGDATLTLADGTEVVGFVFDLTADGVAYVPQGGGEPKTLPRADITKAERSGRDFADGKSWEAWVKKYNAKKAAEKAAEPAAEPVAEPVASA